MKSIELERTETDRAYNINIENYKIDFRKKENELSEKKVSFIFKIMKKLYIISSIFKNSILSINLNQKKNN